MPKVLVLWSVLFSDTTQQMIQSQDIGTSVKEGDTREKGPLSSHSHVTPLVDSNYLSQEQSTLGLFNSWHDILYKNGARRLTCPVFLLQTSCHLQKTFQATHFERNSVNPNSMASLVVLFPSFLLFGQIFRQRGLAHFLLYSALSFHTLRAAPGVGPCSERALSSVICAKMAMVWHSGSGDNEGKGSCSSNFWQEWLQSWLSSAWVRPACSNASFPALSLLFSSAADRDAQERGDDIKTRHFCS